MSWYPPYVSVAQKRAKAERKIKSLKKKFPGLQPVVIEGRALAVTWWGKMWNKNLERYADYSNRIGRGRSYARHRAVLDLQIKSGKVTGLVLGSARKPYEIEIKIKAVAPAKWATLRRDCQGQLRSLQDLLAGKISKDMAEIFFSEDSGLFPAPKDISFSCSCPDWADMCKHVAAVLYGVGARFDEDPQLFFKLRGVNIDELITQAVKDKTASLLKKSSKKSGKVIDDADLGAVFGIEMDMNLDMKSEPDFGKKLAPARKKSKSEKNKVEGKPQKSAKTLKPKRKAAAKVKKTSETPIKNQKNGKLAADSSAKTISTALLAAITAAGAGGCSMAQLAAVTGCPKSRLYTIVHRLKQQGKIKSKSRGVYELISGKDAGSGL